MTNEELSKLKSDINKFSTITECFMGNCDGKCTSNIIRAHSLQRMGCLSLLEHPVNNNNALYTPTELKPIGKKKASTFTGFCGHHDNEIFRTIEENPNSISVNSDKDCFLLSFRAFAITYHRIKEDIKLLSVKGKHEVEKVKKLIGKQILSHSLEWAQRDLNELELYKNFLIKALLSEDYSCLEYFTYEIDHTIPVAACMLTTPPITFEGKLMNMIPVNQKSSDIITSLIPLKNKSIAIVAAFQDSPLGACFLDELDKMPKLRLERALTWHVLTDMENYFMSPVWYDNLTIKEQETINALYSYSMESKRNTLPPLCFSNIFRCNFFDKRYAII